ncbi:MAG TPA: large-conductance mechanosensitive channel protein MscL [Erysipelotrichaceae bacterium]|nr:large-conductance mechanosensitive channel protein MscL [Erysipelotrichaceae bacterium]
MKKHLDEFKAFALKGNVMDLAVGVIIGGAFGKIVSSLVNDLVMPLLSTLTGNVNYADLKIVLNAATETQTEVAILYGNFIKSTIDFFLIALSIFFIVKFMSRMKKKEDVVQVVSEPVEDSLSVLKEIRDSLKNK